MILFVLLILIEIFTAQAELSFEDRIKVHKAFYGYEGDMRFTAKQRTAMRTRNAVNSATAKWKDGIIPYVVDNSIWYAEVMVQRAADHIRKNTNNCIKFIKRTNENDYVEMKYGTNGCWSWIGKKGGRQELHLGYACNYFGIVLHEMLHAVGFAHEQNRFDRDNYVKINWQNIQSGQMYNFANYYGQTKTSFDFYSIMIYGEYSFSNKWGELKTMEDKSKRIKLLDAFEKTSMSVVDAYDIKEYYGCR